MIRDPFGFTRLYHDVAGRAAAPTIRALFAAQPDLSHALDREGVAAHLAGRFPPDRTCFAAVRALPPGHRLVATADGLSAQPYETVAKAGDLLTLLRAAVAKTLANARGRVAVALSGGLDSALVLALVHEVDPSVPAFVLDPRLDDDYGEREAALTTARQIGAEVVVFPASAAEFPDALPAAIAAFETPIYNLHPLAKLLLARAARAAGVTTIVSGDGADQVFGRDDSANYLPLASAAFASVEVALAAPFLEADVVACILATPPDRDKQRLRQAAAQLPIPLPLVHGPKISKLAPPIALDDLVSHTRLRELATMLALPPPLLRDDRERVRWTTLALLADTFDAHEAR